MSKRNSNEEHVRKLHQANEDAEFAAAFAMDDDGDADQPNWAEQENEKQIKATREEHQRKRQAATKKNPLVAFAAFKDVRWGGYGNMPVAVLAALAFRSGSFGKGANTKQSRARRSLRRQRFCNFLADYALMYFAKKIHQHEKRDDMLKHQTTEPPKGFNPAKSRHQAIGAAMYVMQRKGGEMPALADTWDQVEGILQTHDIKHNATPRFQFSLALLGSEFVDLSERDLRVLFAVNSCCRKKACRQTSSRVLGMRAVGAINETMLEQLDIEPLSRKQVERSLDKLTVKGLIWTCVWRQRILFVAKRGDGELNREEFQDLVRGMLERRQEQKRQAQETGIVAHTNKMGRVEFSEKGEIYEDGDF